MVFGQPARLSKEVCLYADADWLKLICQSHSEDIEPHIMVRGGVRGQFCNPKPHFMVRGRSVL